MSRTFPLGVVISAYRDRLLCPFDEYREFLNFMTGRDLWLFEVPAARRTVAKVLAKRLPGLAATKPPPEKTDSGNATKYVKECAAAIGRDQLTLDPLDRRTYKPITLAQRTKQLGYRR